MKLFPEPAPEVRQHLESVFERASSKTLPMPPWIAVDNDDSSWYMLASRKPRAERAQAIVATSNEASLLIAHRLGIGGALRLPPSTPAATLALEAARTNPAPVIDIDLVSWCLTGNNQVWLVSWRNSGFWRQQLGGLALSAVLSEVAELLDIVPTILGFPALLVAGRSPDEIGAAWKQISRGRLDVPAEGIEILQVDPALCSSTGLWLEAARVLLGTAVHGVHEMKPRSIYALPQGRRVGRWSVSDIGTGEVDFWTPRVMSGEGLVWQNGRGAEIVEAASSEQVLAHDQSVVRLPGWVVKRLRRGAPNGVLLERLAAASQRSGVTLWVPNVDQDALEHLLRLGVPLWVDGPAVPE